jgi:hypothetical protein
MGSSAGTAWLDLLSLGLGWEDLFETCGTEQDVLGHRWAKPKAGIKTFI